MRLINQSCQAYIQEPGLEGIYKQIERAGRTCYHSSDKITEESAKPFVDRMIKSNHTAMLEHGTVYLKRSTNGDDKVEMKKWNHMFADFQENPYSKVNVESSGAYITMYITTNYRVIIGNGWEEDLQYLCEPTEYHVKRYTLACTTALHCYKDLTRHRTMSFAIESTRYCNYAKEKFGNELIFIKPSWLSSTNYEGLTEDERIFWRNLEHTEYDYIRLIDKGWQAQQAAEILPQCIKGDMIITGFEDDWKHLLDLRYYGTTGAPHPMVKELAGLMRDELNKLGLNY